ncbi:MAG: hypothetical protein QE271_14340 [Bacteriovoracaceae bacterium]|nr:hypothetical protein [Bacteriovoracaceae bacterium]
MEWKKNKTFVFIAHTSIQVKSQTVFAIYSLMKQNSWMLLDPKVKIIIYTEDELFFKDYFQFIGDWKEKIQFQIFPLQVFIDYQKVPKGKNLHRVKLKVFEHFFHHVSHANDGHPSDLLYCDSDVYAIRSLDEIMMDLDVGHTIFHLNEGAILNPPNYGIKKVRQQLLALPETLITLDKEICMFNAGLFWCPIEHKEIVDKSLKLCDEIFEINALYFAEQFAVSYWAKKLSICAQGDKEFIHYWYMKEFNSYINHFLGSIKTLNSEQEVFFAIQNMALNKVPNYRFFKSIYFKIYKKWRFILWKLGLVKEIYHFACESK